MVLCFLTIALSLYLRNNLRIHIHVSPQLRRRTQILKESTYKDTVQNVTTKDVVPKRAVSICEPSQRTELLYSKCNNTIKSKRPLTKTEKRERYGKIYVDEKHKLLVCLPPKAACTTWKAILANNTGPKPLSKKYNVYKLHYGGLESFGIKPLSSFSTTMQQFYIQSSQYYKIMVARHPFDRIYSAYVNKFKTNVDLPFKKKHGYNILNLFHKDLPKETRKKGEGVTFSEFIQYTKLPMGKNPHWEPTYNLCEPCEIHYDKILKVETLDPDTEDVIQKHLGPYHRGLGTSNNVVLGLDESDSLGPAGREIEQYSELQDEDMQYLSAKFQKDLEYFGYTATSGRTKNGKNVVHTSCTKGGIDTECC